MSNDHEHLEHWPASPPLWAVVATDGDSNWPWLYSIWPDEADARNECERLLFLDEETDIDVVACRIILHGFEAWRGPGPAPWATLDD